jgi:hypothetical protein
MNVKKPPLVMKEKPTEGPTNNGTTRPKNLPANLRPTEGYICGSARGLGLGDSRPVTIPVEVRKYSRFLICSHRLVARRLTGNHANRRRSRSA